MAFKSRLKLADKEYDVLSCSFTLTRDTDAKGRPSSGIYGGQVDIQVESTADTSIIESMVNNPFKALSGSLIIKKTEEDAKMKELVFENAYIISYNEGMNANGKDPMAISFTISAQTLKLGNAEHVNDWPQQS